MTLAVDILTDLPIFTNTDEFGTEVTYRPKRYHSSNGVTIYVIWDDAIETIEEETGSIETTAPQCVARTSDLLTDGVSPLHGDKIINGTTTYKVIGIHPDGTGMTTLILSELSG